MPTVVTAPVPPATTVEIKPLGSENKPAYNLSGLPSLKDFAKQPTPTPKTVESTAVNEQKTEVVIPADAKKDFAGAWDEYVQGLRDANKRSLVGLFEKTTPDVQGANVFVLHVPHKVSADMVEDERQDMMVFLRRRTGNTDLTMQVDIVQSTENDIVPYTNREKFDSLVQKNPKLMDLKNALDLEIE